MEIKITSLRIKNFRNLSELNINFKDSVNEIVAQNGIGKTNTLSAIMWCLFGKSIYDDKKFVISPIIDGEERNDVTTEVTLVINGNYVVTRLWYQRKATLMTGYVIDGREEKTTITQSKFTDELREKFDIDEEMFKKLSNINCLPNLHWKDLKDFIFSLIGEVKDEEVLLRGDFSLVEQQIKLMGVNDTKDSLLASDKALNDEIKRYETEYQTLVNTKEKYVADEKENEQLENRKKEIEDELDSVSKKIEEQQKYLDEYRHKETEISNLKIEIQQKNNQIEFNNNAIEDYKKSYELNSVSVDVIREKEKSYIQSKIDSVQNRLNKLDESSEKYTNELEETKNKGKELQAKEIKVENDTCNACGQKLPEERIQATLDNLKKQQLEELNKLQGQVNDLTTIIGSNSVEYEQKTQELEELKKQLEEVDRKVYEEQEESEKQKEIRVARENKELENKTLREEIDGLNVQLEKMNKEFETMEQPTLTLTDTASLRNELNEINNKLATTITLNKINEDIEKSDENLTNAKNQKNTIKNKIEQVAKFNNLKAELVRQKAKSHFKIVDFKTKNYTQDGIEQETFLIQVGGIEYKELNSAMKIHVAVDLLSGIQRLKDIQIPILIDNAECLSSNIEPIETQIIMTKVEKNQPIIKVNWYE